MAEWTFTETERHIIDGAYHKMETGEPISPDEMQLVLRFKEWEVKASEETRIYEETKQAESQARIEQDILTQEIARQHLQDLAAIARAEFERTLNNVETQ